MLNCLLMSCPKSDGKGSLLDLLTTGSAMSNDGVTILQAATILDTLQLRSSNKDALGRDLQNYLLARIMPCLRIFALCHARWQDSFHVHDEDGSRPVVALSLPYVGIMDGKKKPRDEKVGFLALLISNLITPYPFRKRLLRSSSPWPLSSACQLLSHQR